MTDKERKADVRRRVFEMGKELDQKGVPTKLDFTVTFANSPSIRVIYTPGDWKKEITEDGSTTTNRSRDK